MTLIRSMMSKEADHERAVYNMKTGYRPNPTVVHPSIGAVVCHELADPVNVQDLHATILHALSIDPEREIRTPVGRPIALSDGRVVRALLD